MCNIHSQAELYVYTYVKYAGARCSGAQQASVGTRTALAVPPHTHVRTRTRHIVCMNYIYLYMITYMHTHARMMLVAMKKICR
jgi:hypothetical protein